MIKNLLLSVIILFSSGAFAQDDSLFSSVTQDSLHRKLALLEIARANEEVASTDFLHRLIPKVQASASLGVREIVFPEYAGAFVLPRDSYRLSLSLSIGDLLDGSKHALALIQLDRAEVQYAILLQKQAEVQIALDRKLRGQKAELLSLKEELKLTEALLQYHELLFEQGKTEFPALSRIRLEVLRLASRARQLERSLTR